MRFNTILIACALANSACVFAQQSSSIETLHITGTRLDKQPNGGYTSLDREQIDKINPASTLDLLRRVPHLSITQNGSAGGLSFVSMRGGESNFTLVLIDGVAMNDSTNSRGGGFDFNQINPAAIEKVEVYRGGISAIYGGDAISGVIHFTTRQAPVKLVQVELGNQKQRHANIAYSEQFNNGFSGLVSFSSQQREQSSFSDVSSQQFLVKSTYANEQWKSDLLLTFNDSENTSFAEDSGGELFALPPIAEHRASQQWLLGSNNQIAISNDLTLFANLSWLSRKEDSNHPGIADGVLSGIPASNIESALERVEIELYADVNVTEDYNIIFGVNQRDSTGENRGFIDFGQLIPIDYSLSQDTQSVFAEGQYEGDIFNIDLGLRYDKSDNFSSETSIRISGKYKVTGNSNIVAVYNEGYKLPSFFALAHPLVGNSTLKPERSDNIELAYHYHNKKGGTFTLGVFDNEYSDLVDFEPTLFTNVNRSKIDVTGVEFSANSTINSWLIVSGDISYQDVDSNSDNTTLRRRPNWFGGLALDANWRQFQLSIFSDFSSGFSDSSVATGARTLGGYNVFGLASNWRYSNDITVTANVENVLAKSYQESVGFVVDERSVRLGIQYRL